MPALKSVHLRQIFDEYSPALGIDYASTLTDDRTPVQFYAMAEQLVLHQAQVMYIRHTAHYRRFCGNDANRLFGRLTLTYFLIQISKGFDKEKRRHDR
ncbi:MAG: hypothetical protein ACLQDV_30680 [Candidatus Binataceae bacterium]